MRRSWNELLQGLDSKQLELLEEGNEQKKRMPAKRVNIVSLKVIKESSVMYKGRRIRSPRDSYELMVDDKKTCTYSIVAT